MAAAVAVPVAVVITAVGAIGASKPGNSVGADADLGCTNGAAARAPQEAPAIASHSSFASQALAQMGSAPVSYTQDPLGHFASSASKAPR